MAPPHAQSPLVGTATQFLETDVKFHTVVFLVILWLGATFQKYVYQSHALQRTGTCAVPPTRLAKPDRHAGVDNLGHPPDWSFCPSNDSDLADNFSLSCRRCVVEASAFMGDT